MSRRIFLALLLLALAAFACRCNVNLPKTKTPGPDVSDTISADAPQGEPAHLTLSFGAGKLMLAPGAGAKLVNGTATYNIPDFKPAIITDGSNVEIKQGDYKVNGFPTTRGIKNEWDLKLGNMPLDLTIHSGAYDGKFDLGGLALTNLTISDGAADVKVDFSAPNPEKMSVLTYKTGASNVTLKNLGNANFATLIFESGAGNYTLDFGGAFQRDGSATVRSGMSNLTLVIPEGVAATVQVSGGLSNVQAPSGWAQHGDTYTQAGSGPELTIVVEMGVGNLQISR
jgi:hypothetical protein